MSRIVCLTICLCIALGSGVHGESHPPSPEETARFKRVFVWGRLRDEASAGKFAEIGATDMRVFNREQLEWARKYKITPYCGTFIPQGPHKQVMAPEEENRFAYINGLDLDNGDSADKRREIARRRVEGKHQFGGEPIVAVDTINDVRIACFNSDKGYALSKQRIDELCRQVEGAQGVFMDYIGYSNLKGCYCEECLAAYQSYLDSGNVPDNEERRGAFYLERLTTYINAMVDYVKECYPSFTVVIHLYPTFLPNPLYGNRVKADFCGQTVAWYSPWPAEKIFHYTKVTLSRQEQYFKGVQGVPFVGLNQSADDVGLWRKDGETLARELRTILAAGSDTLMVCDGNDMLLPGVFEVFKRYCAPKP